MRRSIVVRRANRPGFSPASGLVLLAGALLAGCDGVGGGASALPPAPPPAVAKAVGLILPSDDLKAAELYAQSVRSACAKAGVVLDLVSVPTGEQAAAIRDRAGRGLAALLVVPGAAPEIDSALAEVEAAGTPVIVMVRPPGPAAEGVMTARFPSAHETAAKLVEAGLKAARDGGFSEDIPAVLLVNGPLDSGTRPLVDALHKALEEAGVTSLPDLNFEGYENEAKAVLEPLVKERPDLGLVLFIDDYAANAAASVRNTLDREQPRFALAGFTYRLQSTRMADFGIAAAVAERRPEILAYKALQSALDLAEGREVPRALEIPERLVYATGPERMGFFPGDVTRPPSPDQGESSAGELEGDSSDKPAPGRPTGANREG